MRYLSMLKSVLYYFTINRVVRVVAGRSFRLRLTKHFFKVSLIPEYIGESSSHIRRSDRVFLGVYIRADGNTCEVETVDQSRWAISSHLLMINDQRPRFWLTSDSLRRPRVYK